MEHTRTIDKDSGLITVTVEGVVTMPEIMEAYAGTFKHEDFLAGSDTVWDISNATIPPTVTATKLLELADNIRSFSPLRGTDYKVAVIVGQIYAHSVTKLYGIQTEKLPFEIKVFFEMRDALKWINGK